MDWATILHNLPLFFGDSLTDFLLFEPFSLLNFLEVVKFEGPFFFSGLMDAVVDSWVLPLDYLIEDQIVLAQLEVGEVQFVDWKLIFDHFFTSLHDKYNNTFNWIDLSPHFDSDQESGSSYAQGFSSRNLSTAFFRFTFAYVTPIFIGFDVRGSIFPFFTNSSR